MFFWSSAFDKDIKIFKMPPGRAHFQWAVESPNPCIAAF